MSEIKLSNDYCDLVFGNASYVTSLLERSTGREWQDATFRVPMFGAVFSGVPVAPTSIRHEAGLFQLEFAQIGFSCSVSCRACPEHFCFKVETVSGPRPETLTFCGVRLSPAKTSGEFHHGTSLNTVWDGKFSVTLLSLNQLTEASSLPGRILQARAHDRFGLEGATCALLTVPTERLDRALVDLAARYGLPQPTLGGQPAKLSPVVRRGYLFVDIDANNADQVLDWAKQGRFGHVMFYAGVWQDRFGHFRVHPERFPGGTPTFKAIVDRFHNAGIGVGIHSGSANIGWEDPYMTPVPDRRLASAGRFRLAASVSPTDRWLVTDVHPLLIDRRVVFDYRHFQGKTNAVAEGESPYSETVSIHLDDREITVRVDDELIRVRHLTQGMGFEVIERGMYGTVPARHEAGADIVVLRQLYGSFLMDVYSTLLGEVADSVAAIYNECGLDMIYFDCGEWFEGPAWHSRALLHHEFLRRFNRECLVQGSGYPHFSWHWFARYGTSDRVPNHSNEHVDHTRVPRALDCRDNRLPADLGWFQLYAESPAHPATKPEEVDYLCQRAEELGAAISIETSVEDMRKNPATSAMLEIVARHERKVAEPRGRFGTAPNF